MLSIQQSYPLYLQTIRDMRQRVYPVTFSDSSHQNSLPIELEGYFDENRINAHLSTTFIVHALSESGYMHK